MSTKVKKRKVFKKNKNSSKDLNTSDNVAGVDFSIKGLISNPEHSRLVLWESYLKSLIRPASSDVSGFLFWLQLVLTARAISCIKYPQHLLRHGNTGGVTLGQTEPCSSKRDTAWNIKSFEETFSKVDGFGCWKLDLLKTVKGEIRCEAIHSSVVWG